MRAALYILATLLSLPLLAQTAKPSQAQASTLTIRVTDESGAVIAKAFVLIHSDALEQRTLKPFTLEPENSKPFSMELRTSSEGEAKGELSSGFYDLFIGATGFAPYCEKIRVRDGRPLTVKAILRIVAIRLT